LRIMTSSKRLGLQEQRNSIPKKTDEVRVCFCARGAGVCACARVVCVCDPVCHSVCACACACARARACVVQCDCVLVCVCVCLCVCPRVCVRVTVRACACVRARVVHLMSDVSRQKVIECLKYQAIEDSIHDTFEARIECSFR
jgi:hypothetical protein